MTVQLLPGAGVPEQLNLSSLISLGDAGFQDGWMCYRGIDEDNVEHLFHSEMADWKPIRVVICLVDGSTRHAVIDGYHRWEAAKRKKAPFIMACSETYAGEDQVIEEAFRANLKNGRGASSGERSQYAFWLYLQDSSDKPNLSAIARKVGLNQSTVSRYINKELKRLDAEEEAEGSGTSVTEINETQRLLSAIRRYMEQETAFFSGEHGERSVKKRASSIHSHLQAMKDKTKAQRAIKDLQSLALTLAEFKFSTGSQPQKKAQ